MGDGYKPKTTRKKVSLRSGIFTLTQKELKQELEKIELARRQYRNAHAREQRKIITRLAFKFIRSSSDLEHLTFNNNNKNSSSLSNYSTLNVSNQNNTVDDLNDDYQDVYLESKTNSGKSLPITSTLKREKTFSGSQIDHFGIKSAKSEPYRNSITAVTAANLMQRSSSLKNNQLRFSREESALNETLESSKSKPKKNVKFNEALLAKEKEKEREKERELEMERVQHQKSLATQNLVQMHKNSSITLTQVSKKYDEFMLMNPDSASPQIMIPQLISFKHAPINSTISVSSKRPQSSPFDEQKRLNKQFSEKFQTIINENENGEESGFYEPKNEKDEYVCAGYDNYVKQLELNIENPIRIVSAKKDDDKQDKKNIEYFPNPFNHVGLTPESILPHIPKIVKPPREPGDLGGRMLQKRFGSRVQSAISHKQNVITKNKEEDDLIASETFRVLKIRSLTFKPVTLY